jgi:hypothetical protein
LSLCLHAPESDRSPELLALIATTQRILTKTTARLDSRARRRLRQRGGPRGPRVYRTEASYRQAIRDKILTPASNSGWNLGELRESVFAEQLGLAYNTYLAYNERYDITPELAI